MHTLVKFSILTALICTFLGCNKLPDSDKEAVPRRRAFPRIEAYDTVRARIEAADVAFSVNAAATVALPRPGWVDAAFPRYGAVLHLSAITERSPEELARAIANRKQRMALNLGGARARTDRFTTAAGTECELIVAAEGVATPVQFLAADPAGRLVSGAFVLGGGIAPADSLRPVVALLEEEAFAILNSITPLRRDAR